MKEVILPNGKRTWRCTAKHCRATRSIRVSNSFFYYSDGLGRIQNNLGLHDILLIVYLGLNARIPVRMASKVAGHSQNTIVDGHNFRRTTCGKILDNQPKLVGTEL